MSAITVGPHFRQLDLWDPLYKIFVNIFCSKLLLAATTTGHVPLWPEEVDKLSDEEIGKLSQENSDLSFLTDPKIAPKRILRCIHACGLKTQHKRAFFKCSFLYLTRSVIVNYNSILTIGIGSLTPLSHWQKSFVTFGLGSSSQILVANWKKYPCQFHWQRGFLALAMAARLGLIGIN